MTFYSLPAKKSRPFWRRSAVFGMIAGLHLLALVLALSAVMAPEIARPLQTLTMRMLDLAPVPPSVEQPKPPPPRPLPVPARKPSPTPLPVITATPAAVSVSSFVVAPQPAPPVAEAPPVAVPAPLAIVAARFDADYLQNPKPAYPAMSRRQGEEGKVVLRVRVSAQGTSRSVEIKQSSGFSRLDDAARAAVEQWRFIPARQGSEAVESSVLVPLNFTLDN